VLQTKAFGAVSKSDLDAWANTYKLPVTAVKDPDGTGTATYNALGVRETVFELDLSTMKILKVIHGSTAGIPPSAVQQATADLHTLLGK
jgi:hypothetical protein